MIHSIPLLLLLQAPTSQLGVEFTAPAGWVAVESPPLRSFAPPTLGQGEVLLLTVWPAERIGVGNSFSDWFERKLTFAGETVLLRLPTERHPATGLEALTATLRVTMPQGGSVLRIVYGIAAGERAAIAMLTSNQDPLVKRYVQEARAFFESLRFPAPAPPAPSLTAIPPAGFDGTEPRGLFYRLQTQPGTTRMETRTRTFLPGKRMLRIDPFGGGDAIDLTRCSPDTCGSFRIEGGSLVVNWDNRQTERLRFSRSGEEFTLDGDVWQPARGLSASELVGSWVSPGSSSTVFQVRDDGSFEWGAGSRETTLRGRYELKGLTLTLHFMDGTSKPYTVFAAGRTRPIGLINLDGTVYARR